MAFLTSSKAQIFLLYGASEFNGVIGCYLTKTDNAAIPMGYPLPSIQCLLIDEHGQMITNVDSENSIGEIHIGGN